MKKNRKIKIFATVLSVTMLATSFVAFAGSTSKKFDTEGGIKSVNWKLACSSNYVGGAYSFSTSAYQKDLYKHDNARIDIIYFAAGERNLLETVTKTRCYNIGTSSSKALSTGVTGYMRATYNISDDTYGYIRNKYVECTN